MIMQLLLILPEKSETQKEFNMLDIYKPIAAESDRLVTNKKRLVAMPTTTSACIFVIM